MEELVTFNDNRKSFSISSASSCCSPVAAEPTPPQVPDIVITECEDIPQCHFMPAATPVFGSTQCAEWQNLLFHIYTIPVNHYPSPDLHAAVLQHHRCHSPFLFMEPQFKLWAE